MTVMNADEIRKLLPHRWPFLLLDRVTELKPGVSGVGIKNVTISEPFFEGHFPNESIMPGVLIVEALAQMTAVVYCTGALQAMREAEQEAAATAELQVESVEEVDVSSRVGYLVAIRDMKFMKPVVPGDQLLLKVKIGRSLGILSKVNVAAYVGKECVVEGTLSVSQRP
ncbi:3-hydroxyacyl-[acyl-carrier-protein] dehydratase [Thermoactinomyces sp. DSM 45891]|uniref:3-hydroxyacyl-ACP dehydratase FabZ n=1 Tax=Thermoactinomyces sp. DSM 45891 TaxID=1761907 RepID=UPI00092220D7|nr:3-hydroxyacyl-ACP dehydratase FabZ [Thermoactinomyces sp. DSM 45891]SFW99668.1 3-hydroxyacyl-[acyl-carrier-protein] dehydratase [Thermoactinomyces sp. DSM 45891]